MQESTSLCDTKYKIVFLGDMGVGKTSVIERFVKDEFDLYNNPTVGIDFLTRNISYQNKTYRLQLWDTAGQEKYKSLVPAYLRDANCSVFVFDWTREDSFKNLKNWIQLYRDHETQCSMGIVIGNKADILEEGNNIQQKEKSQKQQSQIGNSTNNKKLVDQQEVKSFCLRQQLFYMKLSAKTGKGVLELFQKIIHELKKGGKRKFHQNIDKNNKNSNNKYAKTDSIDQANQDPEEELENQVMQKFQNLKLKNNKGVGEENNKYRMEYCYI